MSDPLVSVVIATWNRRDTLRDTLNHFRDQSYPRIEMVVVDNGSVDGTAEMVEREFPAVRLVKLSENIGIAGYNRGMELAQGEIVVVVDNDSYLAPGGIERIVTKFRDGGPQLAVVSCEIVLAPQNVIYEWYQGAVDRDHPPQEGYKTHLFIGAGAGIRKSVLEEVGYYPEEFFMYMNEVDLCTRIIGAGYEIRYFPDVVALHEVAPGARSKARSRLLSFRNIVWYYWKHFPIYVALGRCLVRVPFDVFEMAVKGVGPRAIWGGLVETFGGLPSILRHRKPIPRRYVSEALGHRGEIANLIAYTREMLKRHSRLRARTSTPTP